MKWFINDPMHLKSKQTLKYRNRARLFIKFQEVQSLDFSIVQKVNN